MVDPETMQAKDKKGCTTDIFAVGHLAKGSIYLTSGITFCRCMVASTVSELKRRLAL